MERIVVTLGERSYPITIAAGLFNDPASFLPLKAGDQAMLVTNETLAPLYLDRVRHLLEQGYQSRLTPDDCTIKTICKAANKGDALACEVIEYVGRHLGKTIAIAINLFNPQKIVVAGEIVEAEKVLLPAIEGCINAQALKAFRKNLPVVRSTLDHRSAIGAFALVKRAMLNGTLLQRLLES